MHAQGTPLTHVRINPIDMNTENWDASVEASVIILSTPHHHYYTQQPTRSTSSTTSSPLFFWFTTPSFPFSRYTAVRFSVSFDLIGRGEGTPATPIWQNSTRRYFSSSVVVVIRCVCTFSFSLSLPPPLSFSFFWASIWPPLSDWKFENFFSRFRFDRWEKIYIYFF